TCMETVEQRGPHQLVVRGVVVDDVDPMSEPVVVPKQWSILVGEPPKLLGARAPCECAERLQLEPSPTCPFPLDSLSEGQVCGEDVVLLERRGLVEDLVGVELAD